MNAIEKPLPLSVMIFSYLLCLWLVMIPMPWEWLAWRPEFLLVLMIYWLLNAPYQANMFTVWFSGLLLDGVSGTTFGLNALAFTVVAAFVRVLYQRLRMFDVMQQALVVFLLVGIYQLIMLWGQTFQGGATLRLDFLKSCLASAVSWPFVVISIKRFQHGR